MKIKNGVTRMVFLIGNYAIKIPQVKYEWRHFLLGLLANMQEKQMDTLNDSRMCPVLFSLKGGWLLIMPRCEPLSDEDFSVLDIDHFWEQTYRILDGQTIYYGDCKVPVEHKKDSFGWYCGEIVAIDYGS